MKRYLRLFDYLQGREGNKTADYEIFLINVLIDL